MSDGELDDVERAGAWVFSAAWLAGFEEDVRARIAVLAEIPETWERALDRLLSLVPLPDPAFGSLLWQAILGAWPASRERLHAYAEIAARAPVSAIISASNSSDEARSWPAEMAIP